MENRRNHWERVHATKGERGVSWFEAVPQVSLSLLEAAGLGPDTCVVDVGGGQSHLVDALIARGLRCITVLDVSATALERVRTRLGASASIPTWIASDVTGEWAAAPADIWHDRAVFHFLTDPIDRARYIGHLTATLKPGGWAIIGTFATDGPERCSGLPVMRYSAQSLAAELGAGFRLIDSVRHEHTTPSSVVQPFVYTRFQRTLVDAPIVQRKDVTATTVFSPTTVLSEAMRQKGMGELRVPPVCMLDPDGDIVRWLRDSGRGTLSTTWPCYHSDMYEFDLGGHRVGIVGMAVGAAYAVLLAEEMFVSGCELLLSMTSAGQLRAVAEPPYFVLVTRALRDEGTSYHYLPVSRYVEADPALVTRARTALGAAGISVIEGGTWTTDAPFRETAASLAEREAEGLLAVEMESAALYAFARAKGAAVLCLAHVTNTMGRREQEFEKGDDEGVAQSLKVVEALLNVRVGR